jgi:hypothetical protein
MPKIAPEAPALIRAGFQIRLGQFAQSPQTPHIEGDMSDADVNEDASQQAPPLAPDGQRAKICPPMHEIGTRRREEGNSSERHAQEDSHVDAENGVGDNHRTGLRPRPGRGFHPLDGHIFATLRRFVLHAPRAKLLAEAETRKLTTALGAICHSLAGTKNRNRPSSPERSRYKL